MPPITGLNVLTAIADFDASLLDPNTAPSFWLIRISIRWMSWRRTAVT